MALPIPTALVEFILLGPLDDRRQLQDSPILGDVWVEFGRQPDKRLDLLIEPFKGQHAGTVAAEIDQGLWIKDELPRGQEYPDIAFLHGMVAARLTFEEVMRIVVPKTQWWMSRRIKDDDPRKIRETGVTSVARAKTTATLVHEVTAYDDFKDVIQIVLDTAFDWHLKKGKLRLQEVPPLTRFLGLTALILWAGSYGGSTAKARARDANGSISHVLRVANANLDKMHQRLRTLVNKMFEQASPNTLSDTEGKALIWQVSRNRNAMPAISRSVPAVKADAATHLFKVNCKDICWAVLDSGIDGQHPAFTNENGKSRVKRSFDFKNFRKIVNIGNSRPLIRKRNVDDILKDAKSMVVPINRAQVDEDLATLAQLARNRGPIRWELIQRYVEINPATTPSSNHGTHVAGIIGASEKSAQNVVAKFAADKAAAEAKTQNPAIDEVTLKLIADAASQKAMQKDNPDFADGMCPDISLYDFRVLSSTIKDTEFAIIAALQFIRYLNSQDSFLTIHGANLSLSIPHDVRNFACGRTPICDECDQLVSSGVVVVAAAGNHGYKSFETKDGSYDSYAAFSITDPGNADSILTVGATHRFWPHTYGVSFFSSRGPTGDGRMKPDLVAPGERIRAPLPGGHNLGGEWGDLDGTSMAAPHVSGAAAMLMARYSELIGQPRRIKRILCESATDLERERSFQGHGMLDVLRALQSI